MADLQIPDVSEYQHVDFGVFAGPIIVRAHNGRRVDHRWADHAAGAARQPWWAAYQYLPATVDPATAAAGFLQVLEGRRPWATFLDLEEGEGDQSARQHAWLQVMAHDPAVDWTYSGLYFARAHGLTVEWVAAYQAREPAGTHRLWQHTNARPFPGIGSCDASVFHGSVADLQALTQPGGPEVLDPTDPIVQEIRLKLDELKWIGNDAEHGIRRMIADLGTAIRSLPGGAESDAAAIAEELGRRLTTPVPAVP